MRPKIILPRVWPWLLEEDELCTRFSLASSPVSVLFRDPEGERVAFPFPFLPNLMQHPNLASKGMPKMNFSVAEQSRLDSMAPLILGVAQIKNTP